jgi:hypothetical protein
MAQDTASPSEGQLTERQKKWFASARAGLERDTPSEVRWSPPGTLANLGIGSSAASPTASPGGSSLPATPMR